MPHDSPPAMTIYDVFRRWAKTGVWQRIHDALRDLVYLRAGRESPPTAAIVGSQTVRGTSPPTRWAAA
jgi:transposase